MNEGMNDTLCDSFKKHSATIVRMGELKADGMKLELNEREREKVSKYKSHMICANLNPSQTLRICYLNCLGNSKPY